MQFLSGLNDSYNQERRQILMKSTEPSLNQAYAMITEYESQRSASYSAAGEKGEPLAMQAGKGQPYKGKKSFMRCDYYGLKGHLKENHYKLMGYPSDFKNRKKFVANNVMGNAGRENVARENDGINRARILQEQPYFIEK